MKMLKRFTVKKNERGLLLRNGDFVRLLRPGTHWRLSSFDDLCVEIFALERVAFNHHLTDYLVTMEPKVVAAEFVRVELSESQVGLRTENGVLVELLGPTTRRLYWKGLVDVQVEVIDIAASAEVPAAVAARLVQTQLRQRDVLGLFGVLQVLVPQHEAGILWINGKVDRLLAPGSYAFWKYNRHVSVELVNVQLRVLEFTGQAFLTRDKVTLLLNLSATWRFTDVLKAYKELFKPTEHLYRELLFGLRSVLSTRSVDEFLENTAAINDVVTAQVNDKLVDYGMKLESVGVKDIVLPGELKAIFTQVVVARKAAELNEIRCHTEVAASRALLDSAQVLEGNPVAVRMKVLKTLERVAARIDKISVFGDLDQVLDGLVKLR